MLITNTKKIKAVENDRDIASEMEEIIVYFEMV